MDQTLTPHKEVHFSHTHRFNHKQNNRRHLHLNLSNQIRIQNLLIHNQVNNLDLPNRNLNHTTHNHSPRNLLTLNHKQQTLLR